MSRKQKLGSVFLSTIVVLLGFFMLGAPTNLIAAVDTSSRGYGSIQDGLNIPMPLIFYDTSGNQVPNPFSFGNNILSTVSGVVGYTNVYNTSNIQTLYAGGQTGNKYLNADYYSVSDGNTIAIYSNTNSITGAPPALVGVISNAQSATDSVFHRYNTPIPKSDAAALETAINSAAADPSNPSYKPYTSLNLKDSSNSQQAVNSAATIAATNEVRNLQDLERAYKEEFGDNADPAVIADYEKRIATAHEEMMTQLNKVNDAADAQRKTAQTKPDPLICIEFKAPYIHPAGCLAQLGEQLLKGASWILWFSANLFDKSLDYSLNFKNIINEIPMVELGWKIFRDVSNICFIFILLIIAIGIIVDKSNIGSKSMIAGVLAAALLINFSLFFTKVIIDGSNILALQFYGEIRGDPSQHPTDANGKLGPGISAAFVQALDLTTIYKYGDNNADTSSAGGLTLNTVDPWNIVIVTFGGTVLILVTSFVFLAAAALFIIRSLVLIILMITAPIAYMAQALPNATLKSAASTWWKRLSNECIFAPVYMMMTYVLVSAISAKGIGTGAAVGIGKGSFASLFAGNASQTGTAFTFFLLIGFMVSTLTVAKSLGATGAATAISYGKVASNATKNWVVRNTAGTVAGQVGSRLANSNMMNKWAGSSVGRVFGGGLALKSVAGLANAKIGGQSYNERTRAKQDAKDATAKAIKDATFREKHMWENDADYKTAREGFDKKQKDRINNVQGVGKNGEPVGFTGFSYASRQAARANRAKAMKSFKDEGDKEEIRKNTKEKSLKSLELFAPEIKNEAERTFKAIAGNSNKEFEMNSENIEKMQALWQKNIRDAEITQNGDLVGGDVKTLIDSMKVMTDELKTGFTAAGVAVDPTRAAYNNGQLTIKANELQALKGKVDLHYDKLIDAEKKKEADKSAGLLEELVRQGKQKK